MIKYLIIIFSLCSLSAKTFVIEIADFNCKYCKEAEALKDDLLSAIEENNDEFSFAPLSSNQASLPIMEYFYNSIKEDAELERKIREIFFETAQEHRIPLESYEDIIDWLETYYYFTKDEILKIDSLLSDREKDFNHLKAYYKTIQLAKKVNLNQTPTFVIVNGENGLHKVKRTEKMTTKEYIEQTLSAYKRISK